MAATSVIYRRMVITRHGGPEVLKLIEDTMDAPGAHQIRVKVEAAGVAYTDVAQRVGVYPNAPNLPYTPGYDVTGTVDAVGENVQTIQLGQTVVALARTALVDIANISPCLLTPFCLHRRRSMPLHASASSAITSRPMSCCIGLRVSTLVNAS